MAVFFVSGIPEKNFSVRFETYTQKKRQPTSTQNTEGDADDADDDHNDNDDDDNPNVSELQVVPFQGHPFIILLNDLTYHCKFGKDCDIQYRRKMQQLKPKVHARGTASNRLSLHICDCALSYNHKHLKHGSMSNFISCV